MTNAKVPADVMLQLGYAIHPPVAAVRERSEQLAVMSDAMVMNEPRSVPHAAVYLIRLGRGRGYTSDEQLRPLQLFLVYHHIPVCQAGPYLYLSPVF